MINKTKTDEEKIKDYDRLQYEYTQIHQEFRKADRKKLSEDTIRELLMDYENFTSLMVLGKEPNRVSKLMVEDYLRYKKQ